MELFLNTESRNRTIYIWIYYFFYKGINEGKDNFSINGAETNKMNLNFTLHHSQNYFKMDHTTKCIC